jgi:hypothetical protein
VATKNDDKKPEAKAAGPWRVRTPNRSLDRFHTPYRLRFVNGEVTTADPRAAEHCAGCGYEVTDLATEDVRNPLDGPAATAAKK